MIFRDAGFMQADQDDCRIPDRRKTRLDADGILFLVLQLFQFMGCTDNLRMVVGITKCLEGDQ